MQPGLDDKQRHHRAQTSKAMKKEALSRRCRKCGRQNATTKEQTGELSFVRVCRFCGHEHVTDYSTPPEQTP